MKIGSSKYLPAIKVATWYVLVGVLWIYFSDLLINILENNPKHILFFQTIKGTFFVVVSAILIYILVNRELKKIRAINAELNEAKNKLSEAQRLGKIGSWEFDIKSKIVSGSEETTRIFGFPLNTTTTTNELLERIHPDDREHYLTQTQNWINGVKLEAIQYRIIVDNNIKYIKEKVNAVKDEKGQIVRLHGTVQDFTEETIAQQQLAEKEMTYRLLAENTTNMVILHDKTGFPEYISPNVEKLLGYTPDEYKQLTPYSRVYAEDVPTIQKNQQAIINGQEKTTFSFRFRKKNNEIVWLESRIKSIKNQNGETLKFTSTTVEITERKNFEDKLSNNEKQFRMLFENMPVAYALHEIITNPEGKPVDYTFLKVNSKFEELTGYKADQIIGKTVLSVFPKTESYWIENYAKVALTGEPIIFSNYAVEMDKYYEVSAYCPEKGKFATTFFDITDRIETNRKIQRYQAKLKELIFELFLTEEREKRQLAIDLHDHFSQLLALSKMKISEFVRQNKAVENNQSLVDARKYLEQALNKARSITYDLSPPVLYEFGLLEAMDWFINKVKEEHQIDFKLYKKLDDIQFSQEIQSTIYRIFTELITNIIKHAAAKSVVIIIEEVKDMFYLRVSDDGVGFDTEVETIDKKSFGLFSIKERVEQLKGKAHYVSKKGQGTVTDISIPLK